MHRVDVTAADAHSKLHELHVDAFLLGAKRRVHHHQVHHLAPQLKPGHVRVEEIEAPSLHFLL